MTLADLTAALESARSFGLTAGQLIENAVHETPHTLWSISDEQLTRAVWAWLEMQQKAPKTPENADEMQESA